MKKGKLKAFLESVFFLAGFMLIFYALTLIATAAYGV